MKLHLIGSKVFVEISPTYLLFVAEVDDLIGKTPAQVWELAQIAIREARDDVGRA